MIKEAENFKTALDKRLVIDDWEAVVIVLAAVAAHRLKGQMFWLRIIGAPGSGKSEVLRTLMTQTDYCATGESFTPSALRRGYIPDDNQELPRMLERWNGKLVITKDFASMMTKDQDSRKEVFGLLRSVWDGILDADYGGKQGHIQQKTHFDWLVATTRLIEKQALLEQELGARFIDLRWGKPIDYRGAIKRAMANDDTYDIVQTELADSMTEFIEGINPEDLGKTDIDFDWLADLANFTATFRTIVDRNSHQEVVDFPEPELGTRIGQGFSRIVKGLKLIGIENYKPYIARLALDCLPRIRRAIFESLLVNEKTTLEMVAESTNVSIPTISTHFKDLKVLGYTREKLNLFDSYRNGRRK